MVEHKNALKQLRTSWLVYALCVVIFLSLGFFVLSYYWQPGYAGLWLALSSAVLAYELWVFWKNLKENFRLSDQALLPELGAGNVASLARGALIGGLFGFLILPPPPGWLAWAPGVLYTIAVLIDFVDGYLARLTNHVTRLGEILDMYFDGLGMLAAVILIVRYDQAPAWYLLIGLGRYIFLAVLWLWQRLGKTVHELPPSNRRRGLAGLQMGFVFVMLLPLFSPPGTHVAALGFGIPFLVSFIYDGLIAIGILPADAGRRFPAMKDVAMRIAPVALRLAAVALLAWHLLAAKPGGYVLPGWIFWGQAVVLLLIALGAAGRLAAILGMGLLGFYQKVLPLTASHYVLVFIFIALVILGTGAFSLWKPEDRLLYRRAGERLPPHVE